MSSILIIGGNSDIGYSTAKIFAKNKYDIHLASRNIEELNIKKEEIIRLFNVKCEVTHLDLLKENSINSFFENNIDSPEVILVACGFLQKNEVDFEEIICVNYSSPLKFIEKSIEKYQSQKVLKTIIGISSVAGDRGKKKNSIYSSAKSAFSSYLDGLRQRLYSNSINVITVKPGWVKTKMTKNINLPKLMIVDPNLVGNKIFKAYKSNKNILYVPEYWFLIMFIYKIVPEFLFKFFLKKSQL